MTTCYERAAVHLAYHACLYELISICVCAFLPRGFEGGMLTLIELVPGHCLVVFFMPMPSCFLYADATL